MKNDETIHNLRARAAKAAKDYQAKNISWDSFMEEFGESNDEKVEELVDLIEHEPKRGGFMGVNEKEWANYQTQVEQTIEALSS
jgi:hypothetical protein